MIFNPHHGQSRMVFGSQNTAHQLFKKIQSCFSGVEVQTQASKKLSNLGLSDISLPSERRKRKVSPLTSDIALGMCENNYVVTAQIRYLSENTRTPKHAELIDELENGCKSMKSALFSSFIPDLPLKTNCD
jgi:hypothetical protein